MFPSPPAAYFQIAFSCLCTIIATPAHPRPGLLPLRSVLALTSPGRPLPHARHHLAPSPCVQCADHTPSGLPDFTLDFVTPQPAFQSGTVFFSILSAAPEGADWSTNTAASQGFARACLQGGTVPTCASSHYWGQRGQRDYVGSLSRPDSMSWSSLGPQHPAGCSEDRWSGGGKDG